MQRPKRPKGCREPPCESGPKEVEEQKMHSSKIEPVEESVVPEGDIDIFYLVVMRKGSDDVIFEHKFDALTTLTIPPQRLREAIRTLSVEIAPYETDCQIVKRGDLPFILVWSMNLGAIAVVTHYTAELLNSFQQILQYFEEAYPDVVKEGGDLSGHVPIVERVKDVLKPALLRKHLPPPPPLQILTLEAINYYFSTTTKQIEQFNSFHAPSKGFQCLLERNDLEQKQITNLMRWLLDNLSTLQELSDRFKIPLEKLTLVLRHLNLFELVSLFSTPL